jgi:histidinol-phosphate aminotransferase
VIRPRAHLANVPSHQPKVGGSSRSRRSLARLAANENPFGPLPVAVRAARRALDDAHRYPDDRAGQLREALARRTGVEPDWIAVGCGSLDLLQQLFVAMVEVGDEVVFDDLPFVEYPRLSRLFGAMPRRVPLADDRVDLPTMVATVRDRTKMLLLCNPHSPTGTSHGHAPLEAAVQAVPASCLVVLDEAYVEYAQPSARPNAVSLARQHRNVVVLRTFSKAYGLAGLRIGYAIAHPSIVELFGKVHLTFAANHVAQAAALASLSPGGDRELQRRIAATTTERARLTEQLRALGAGVPLSQASFILARIPDAQGVAVALRDRGVLVHPVGAGALRITVGTESDDDRLLEAFGGLRGPP